ncbi:YHS domain-containing protein [Chryseolinea sp. H1M3-3]|uniref:YHS domain-containing protein n=1 Tax=Chryseolinea sp. H1M3-3 TaxID=3034144 RepID=UPI0023EB055F|nr:YHS domain-containing protein [Chryseolinea sp. H1M3-3]
MEKDVAILMADLSGYTAMTDAHGGASAAKLVSKYMELVNKSIYGDCQVVQRIGDQVVMISDNPSDLAITAKMLNVYTLEEDCFLSIHAGLHFGSIYCENGNLFGSTINVASRIMNLAGRAQVLCSSDFVDVVEDTSFSFASIGAFKLKNVMHNVEIYELSCHNEFSLNVDPVCHMQIRTDRKNVTYNCAGETYHFCNEHCRELFKADPYAFIMFSKN